MTDAFQQAGQGLFSMVRVDDRLLHGQVVFGWGLQLAPHQYVIIDDEVAQDEWEREAFYSAAPPDVVVEAESVARFLPRWRDWPDSSRTVILIRDVVTLQRLSKGGFREPGGINLGGLHGRAGTHEYTSYLHLSAPDRDIILALLGEGIALFAQDLPSSTRVDGEALRHLLRA